LRVSRIAAPLAALALLALGSAALANMAAPWTPGDPVGEPSGVFRHLDIQRETLAFDLRPLAVNAPAAVTATYRVHNRGEAVTVELLFVSPGIEAGSLTVDGEAVPVEPLAEPTLPPDWAPPSEAPAIGGGERRYTVVEPTGIALLFRATLARGVHELAVSYTMRPSEYHGPEVYRDWQVGYVLAPARSWASFRRLDVTVELPAGWDAATSLAMTREGDRLSARFDGVPADTLAITVRHPLDASEPEGVGLAAVLAGSVPLLLAGWWAGRAAARRRWSGGHAAVATLALVVVGGALVAALAAAAMTLLLPAPDPAQVSRTWSYGGGYGEVGIVLLGLWGGALAAVVGMVAGFVPGRRRAGGGGTGLPDRHLPGR